MEKRPYRALFLSTFQLSAFTFGGGYVIVPLMRKKFVDQLHWLEEQEMLDLTAIAQSAPGPIAVNASILVGYHAAGVPGALLTMLGTVTPPLIIISIISLFYAAFRDNYFVNLAMIGMQAGVAAIICDVVISMALNIWKQHRLLPLLVLAGAFAAAQFFDVNMILVILVCGCIGAADTCRRGRQLRKEGKA